MYKPTDLQLNNVFTTPNSFPNNKRRVIWKVIKTILNNYFRRFYLFSIFVYCYVVFKKERTSYPHYKSIFLCNIIMVHTQVRSKYNLCLIKLTKTLSSISVKHVIYTIV